MAELEAWEEIARDLRADSESAREAAKEIEWDSGKDKGYGVKVGEARAFEIAADRIAGEIQQRQDERPSMANGISTRAAHVFHRVMSPGQTCLSIERLEKALRQASIPYTGGQNPSHRPIGKGLYAVPIEELDNRDGRCDCAD